MFLLHNATGWLEMDWQILYARLCARLVPDDQERVCTFAQLLAAFGPAHVRLQLQGSVADPAGAPMSIAAENVPTSAAAGHLTEDNTVQATLGQEGSQVRAAPERWLLDEDQHIMHADLLKLMREQMDKMADAGCVFILAHMRRKSVLPALKRVD